MIARQSEPVFSIQCSVFRNHQLSIVNPYDYRDVPKGGTVSDFYRDDSRDKNCIEGWHPDCPDVLRDVSKGKTVLRLTVLRQKINPCNPHKNHPRNPCKNNPRNPCKKKSVQSVSTKSAQSV